MTRDSKTGGPRRPLLIRRATPADADDIAQLQHLSHTRSFAAFAPAAWVAARDLEAYRRDWHRRLHADDGSGVTCVALEGDRVVGIASASLLPQDATGSRGPIAAIRSVHVHPLRIGVGIGRELWHCVATFLRGQGVVRARVDTIAANARARRFFEAAGCRLVRIAPCGVEGVPVAMYALVLDPPDGAL